MFKKIASIAIAAMLIGSTAAIAATAAENEEAVAAADDSVVAAADDSSVGAEEGSETTGADTKIYFDATKTGWNMDTFKKCYLYLYEHNGRGELITWGSKKGMMNDEGNGKWSFDLVGKGFDLSSGGPYGCIFAAGSGWNVQTCDIMIGPECYGDTAVVTGEKIENTEDSNKSSLGVEWTKSKGTYGVPKAISSIGNVVGKTYWPGEDGKSLLTTFLTSDNAKKNINNALKFNGKDMQTTIDDTAKALGLSWEETKAIVESCKGKNPDIDLSKWDPEKSSLKGTSNQGGNQGGNNQDGGNTTGGTTGGSTGGTTYGGSSGGNSTGSVTSGEDTTVYFIIGGVMIAAIGVFFLARKRRQY